MPNKTNWGILGTGKIAHRFAEALAVVPDAALVAVGSRSRASAEAFGQRYGLSRRHVGYEALAEDGAVDVVYIATPHVFHKAHCLLCLEAGKAVLCEKPFTLNAAEASAVIDAARRRRLFLMEAMWTRFFPAMEGVRRRLADGALGDVRMLTADFGFRAPFDPQHRLFNPALGGGALLDVGVYPVSLASMIWGAPVHIESLAHLGETGVDEQAAMLLDFEGGRTALLHTAIRLDTPVEATVMGTGGRLRIHRRWHEPTRLTLSRNGQGDEVIDHPIVGNGMNYEAAEVVRCLKEGRLESDVMPLDETFSIMQTLDRIRAQWGLSYPGEA